jgi:hypothetical protein
MNSFRRKLQLRNAAARYYQLQQAERVAQGLTRRGTFPVYRQRAELAGLTVKARKVRRQQLDRAELIAQGKTTRGTARINRQARFSPQTLAYQALKAELAAGPTAVPLYAGFADRPVKTNVPTANAQGFMRNLLTRRVA